MLAAVVVGFATAVPARADGVMVYRGRSLVRQGPPARGYCKTDGTGGAIECDRVLTKVLSGYSYARGYATGGLVLDPESGVGSTSGVGHLRLSTIAAALPGGSIAFASIDGVLGDAATRRVRVSMASAEGLFFCRDAHSGALVAPFLGMITRECLPNAIFGVDLAVLTAQWDLSTDRLVAEWARLGPAFELLGNGLGYAHLLRSIELALPFDVRSEHGLAQRGTEASLGVGLRLSALYRTPQWEGRLLARYRTALVGGAGAFSASSVEGELLLLHNFFLTDAVVIQAGLSLRASYSEAPERATVIWASATRHASAFAGLHLGWIHEAPDL